MKKLIAVIVIALVVAAAVWVIVKVQLANRLALVPDLLPEKTLVLMEMPDFVRTRTRWHESDIYQLWREPTVQAWLQKPLAHISQNRRGRKALEDFFALGPKHGFLALTSLENNEPRLIGGFHFERSPEEAKALIEQWESELGGKTANGNRETILYQQHKIETVKVARLVFASVYDNQWFFASNNIATLKALLDRADHRQDKSDRSLQENEAFSAAIKHLPQNYGGMIYLDPQPFIERLMPLVAMTGQSLAMAQLQRLKQVQKVAASVGFDHGKMRETDFVAMPQLGVEKKLERAVLGSAGTDTFFYSASRVHWSDNFLSSLAPAAVGLPALIQQFTSAMNAREISLDDLRQAFGEEFELVGDWPTDAHWPTLVAALHVKDPARARKIVEALASVEVAGAAWTRSDEDGATLYSAQPFSGFVPVRPAVAVSDKLMMAGSDAGAVSSAMKRMAQPAGTLEKSALFQEAAAQVPSADAGFNYIDTRLLYERVDAAARPLLLMGATLYPAVGQTVDPAKLPPREAIAKHLSPIVMSQRYEGGGYVTESVGPVTYREAAIGLVAAVGGLFIYLQEGLKSRDLLQSTLNPLVPPLAAPTASPTPSPF